MSYGPAQPEPPPDVRPYGATIRFERAPGNGMAVASLILGILAILSGIWILVPIIGILFAFTSFVPAVLAVIFGVLGLKRAGKVPVGRGLALTGLILGTLTLGIALLTTAFWVIAIAASGKGAVQQAQDQPVPIQPTAPPTSLAAPEPTQTIYSQGALGGTGTSRYSDMYYATVTGATVEGNAVTVGIDAHGDSLLRAPKTSCVVDMAGNVARADDAALSVSRPGRYVGDLRFSLTGLTGGLSFVYSCSKDYSTVVLLEQ